MSPPGKRWQETVAPVTPADEPFRRVGGGDGDGLYIRGHQEIGVAVAPVSPAEAAAGQKLITVDQAITIVSDVMNEHPWFTNVPRFGFFTNLRKRLAES